MSNRSIQEEDPEVEYRQDLAPMLLDTHIHVTPAIAQHIASYHESDETTRAVLAHLCGCSQCRDMLHETLIRCGKDADHPGYALLAAAEDWARWEAAGREATEQARRSLREQGANIIYERDGVLWEEHPDGTVCRVEAVPNSRVSCR